MNWVLGKLRAPASGEAVSSRTPDEREALDLSRLLRASAALTLVALGLMVWSMVQPTPLPVMLAMSLGQALGTLAFALYGYVVIADVLRVRRARRASEPPEARR
jgi:hypothetical protein